MGFLCYLKFAQQSTPCHWLIHHHCVLSNVLNFTLKFYRVSKGSHTQKTKQSRFPASPSFKSPLVTDCFVCLQLCNTVDRR
ncbi:unnamed protein product [Urochloa humidicola]